MQIHIRRDTEAYGPYTLAEVRTYLGDGRLQEQDQAWVEGNESYRPLVDLLAQLASRGDALAVAPPPEARHERDAPSFTLPATTALGAAPSYQPGGLGARFVASLLDNLVCIACLVPGIVLWIGGGDVNDPSAGAIVVLFAGIIAAVIYNFVKDGSSDGRSVGKRVTGLMVVHLPTNQPCSMGQSALRALIMLLTNLIPYLGWLIEPVMVLAASDRRRLGDRAANTQVIAANDYEP
jgi:uncharacterized RDD family membrane protein YckC